MSVVVAAALACSCAASDPAASRSGDALGWAAGVGVLLMAGAVVFVLYRRLRRQHEPDGPDQPNRPLWKPGEPDGPDQ